MTAKEFNKAHEVGADVVVYRHVAKNGTLTGAYRTKTTEEAKAGPDPKVEAVAVERLESPVPLDRVRPV